jgi:phospholipid transport system substrate-binding protein
MSAQRQSCIAAFGLLFLLTCVMAAAPATAPANTPRAIIEEGSRRVISALRDKTLTPAQQGKQVGQIAGEYIDFDTLSRLSLGQSWRDLSEAQQLEFGGEFKQHVLNICSQSTDGYRNEEIAITSDREELNGDVTVFTHITGKKEGGAPRDVAKVSFRLRKNNGEWKVIDVTIEGVSLAIGFHAQFQAILKEGGFDRLIKLIKDKNAAALAPNTKK